MEDKIYKLMERLAFTSGKGITVLAIILGIIIVGSIVIRLIF